MKKVTLLVMLIAMSAHVFSITDRIKLGLSVSPGVSWMKPTGNEISKGVAGLGLQYGLHIEYYFKDRNYAISTGLFGGIDGGGLKGRDTFKVLTHGASVLERYNTNYLMLPIYLKLKTNPFKNRYILFGEIGPSFVFNVSSRANYNMSVPDPSGNGSTVTIVKENVLRDGNEVQQLIPGFRYQVFDFRLSVAGGMEYIINDKTAVFVALRYNNGFVNQINDRSVNPKKDPTVVRNVLLTFGAMF